MWHRKLWVEQMKLERTTKLWLVSKSWIPNEIPLTPLTQCEGGVQLHRLQYSKWCELKMEAWHEGDKCMEIVTYLSLFQIQIFPYLLVLMSQLLKLICQTLHLLFQFLCPPPPNSHFLFSLPLPFLEFHYQYSFRLVSNPLSFLRNNIQWIWSSPLTSTVTSLVIIHRCEWKQVPLQIVILHNCVFVHAFCICSICFSISAAVGALACMWHSKCA